MDEYLPLNAAPPRRSGVNHRLGFRESNVAKSFARADIATHATAFARFAGDIVSETLWPTRCAVCDSPGEVLCSACAESLEYLDQWRACPRCGAPFGAVQCTECNAHALAKRERDDLPFSACASAVVFTPESGAIVRTFKDRGEIRLGAVIAQFIDRAINPSWNINVITYVPATKAARRRRGFDHAHLLASHLAQLRSAACTSLLEPPTTQDQRALGRAERMRNLEGQFTARSYAATCAKMNPHVLIVDDVFTTGSTLIGASDALLAAGFADVRCATFARVY